ncbi:MAG: hypothetical protein AAGM38_05395 [Pseudomonadota bacterium]
MDSMGSRLMDWLFEARTDLEVELFNEQDEFFEGGEKKASIAKAKRHPLSTGGAPKPTQKNISGDGSSENKDDGRQRAHFEQSLIPKRRSDHD